jgi:hypothetical protein
MILTCLAGADRRAASAATPAPREGAGTAGWINGCQNPLSGVQRPTPMRPCRRSNRQANSRRVHAGRLGGGTENDQRLAADKTDQPGSGWTRILVINPEGKNWPAVCLAVISLQRSRSGI